MRCSLCCRTVHFVLLSHSDLMGRDQLVVCLQWTSEDSLFTFFLVFWFTFKLPCSPHCLVYLLCCSHCCLVHLLKCCSLKSKVSCLSVCIEPQGADPGKLNTADVRLILKYLKKVWETPNLWVSEDKTHQSCSHVACRVAFVCKQQLCGSGTRCWRHYVGDSV